MDSLLLFTFNLLSNDHSVEGELPTNQRFYGNFVTGAL